ncbi:MAG: hypothetical protein J6T15_04695 [Bacilli bacterium]|nr:hypothetical protein [Bacilli bacterium]
MRLINKSLTESIYSNLNRSESLTEGKKYILQYWADEYSRDQGFSEIEYINATDDEDAVAKAREIYYDNYWASCELGRPGDKEVSDPIFGIYGKKEERWDKKPANESVVVTAGSTSVVSDESGVVVSDNNTTISVSGGASVDIDNSMPEPMPVEDPMTTDLGDIPGEDMKEEGTDEEETEETEEEEEVIEPSEELIEPEEEEEEKLEENAGDPNSTVEIFKNPDYDYKITDITELDNVDVGDVRSIDMFSILNNLEEGLTAKYGTDKWGLLNTYQTRQGRDKKTNESYASALLDISIPKRGLKEELNTVLTVEVIGNRKLKECVVKDARYNKRIERFCGKTNNPAKFLEGVIVDLINNRGTSGLVKYKPMSEDVRSLKEQVADEAYEIADIIDKNAEARAQVNKKGDQILRWNDFDEEFILACKKVFGLKDKDLDNFYDGNFLADKYKDHPYSGCEDINELENTVRGILGLNGWETIWESEDDNDIYEGDLVARNWDEYKLDDTGRIVKEDVNFLVNKKPFSDKGVNFADGRAIEKDEKRQKAHLKDRKRLGKTVKTFKVEKEPDQKNTRGKEISKISDIVVKEGCDGKTPRGKKDKKNIEENVNEEAERIMLTPVENFDYIDPYGIYYKDDNGNLYKSDSNGTELYICTKSGEPMEAVDTSSYILGDKALNEGNDKPFLKNKETGETYTLEEVKDKWREQIEDWQGTNMETTEENYPFEMYLSDIDGLQEYEFLQEKDLVGKKKPIKEAKGLLDDEEDEEEVTSEVSDEELVDTDSELDEGTTEVAIFHRKPASVDTMKQAEENGITVNKSNYKIIGTKELTNEEFEDFSKHLTSKGYDWLKSMYKVEDNSGIFNCIEVINKDDDTATKLLVDPNGYDYGRYVAFEKDQIEEPVEAEEEISVEEEPIEDIKEE